MKPPKPRYRTTNWSEYNRSRQARGDLTIWFSPDVAWHANERTGKAGRPTCYSDQAIQIMLTLKVLFRAVQHHRPPAGLIHHTDRGSQYCAEVYGELLTQFRMHSSMSRKGNYFDNAPIESFWGTLKNELVHHRRYATRAKAEASIREYIEIFYNRQRHHSRLGYLAPAEFTRRYWDSAKAA